MITRLVDDAVYLDQDSWALVLALSQNVSGFLMVLATRPINKSYMAAFATEVPEVRFPENHIDACLQVD